jgi:hypothetical protein
MVLAEAGENLVGDRVYFLLGLFGGGGSGGYSEADFARPGEGGDVGSEASRKSWTRSAIADSPIPANHSVREMMEPSVRSFMSGANVPSNIPFISDGTPGRDAKRVPSTSRSAPGAVPSGFGINFVPSGKRACE